MCLMASCFLSLIQSLFCQKCQRQQWNLDQILIIAIRTNLSYIHSSSGNINTLHFNGYFSNLISLKNQVKKWDFLETKSRAICCQNITKMSIWNGTRLDKMCDGKISGKGNGVGEEPLLEKADTAPKRNENLQRYPPQLKSHPTREINYCVYFYSLNVQPKPLFFYSLESL